MAVEVVHHPLIAHKISLLRDRSTPMKDFREIVGEVTHLLVYEATRDLPLREVTIETPLCQATVPMLNEPEIVVAPILRAGLGMLPGMLNILPRAPVAYIGLERDEYTHQPRTYYYNVPANLANATVIVVDPMLATAGSLCAGLDLVKKESPARILAICLIAAPEGKQRVEQAHPDVPVYVGALDTHLNEHAFIVPGLGDAGDRMFGTP